MKHLLTIERLNRFAWKHSYLMFTMSHDQQQQQQQEEAVQKDSSTMQTIASKNENTIDEASSDQPSSSPPPQQQPEDEDSFESPSNFSLYADIALIVLIGGFAAAAFLFVGIRSENKNSQAQFEAAATDLVNKIQTAWESYVTAASMMHNFCRNRNFARADFRGLYEYMISTGLNFQAVQFDPNITDAEREAAEAEARAYYAEYYPHVKYRGFTGFNSENSMDLESRHRSAFYFPIHYMEPVIGNERAIDLDYHAPGSPQRQQTVLACMQTGKPSLTDRLKLVQEKTESAFGVILMHPGVNVTSSDQTWPRDLASIVVRIPDLLLLATTKQHKSCQIYIYDRSDSRGYPLFLGAAHVHPAVVPGQDRDSELSYLSELSIDVAMTGSHYIQDIDAANKIWTVIVRKIPGTFEHNHAFVIFGGVIIFVSSGCLAVWVYTDTVRAQKIQQERAKAKAEKAAYVVQSAQLAANRERELNDFIAHEVRNPVAAAMAACSFVKTALHKIPPFPNKDALEAVCADVVTIDNALLFVNDLLRDMLDMHRATNHQLVVKFTPTDILHDVFEPVEGMLYQREGRMDIHIDCPENLVVMSDRLRLKQVILNLGRNSAKFVDSGFLRMRAQLDDKGMVQLLVEDSGPGIPLNKRGQLFNKYQESLDMLSQGTGIGLFLCKSLVGLMGGTIHLDETYDSGVPGCPGVRFVIDLKKPPIDLEADSSPLSTHDKIFENGCGYQCPTELSSPSKTSLPDKISVLFVDDDPILRKLFARTVKTVAPEWVIREASSGEAALRLVESNHFDVIFCDMYMASVEKSLLGTETVELMRRKGVKSRISGLSANDKEKEFLEAGADCFTFKPFPCERDALISELRRVLYQRENE